MDEQERRALLEAVAAGRLDVEAAAARLREEAAPLDEPLVASEAPVAAEPGEGSGEEHDDGTGDGADADERAAAAVEAERARIFGRRFETRTEHHHEHRGEPHWEETSPPPGSARRVRVTLTAGRTVIVGDPTVHLVDVEGPHEISDDGRVCTIECGGIRQLAEDFDFDLRPGGGHTTQFTIRSRHGRGPRAFAESVRGARGRMAPTVIRVHPEVSLECRVLAGALRAEHLRGPLRAQVDAGSMAVDDLEGPIDVDIHAGSFSGSCRLTHGDSRIDCEAGSINLRLADDSDVTVVVSDTLGSSRITLPGDEQPQRVAYGHQFVVGSGRGRLRLAANLGSCLVSVEPTSRSRV